MNLELITVCTLFATSSAVAVAMFIAWLYLGRHLYALMWAIAGAGAALQWTITIVAHIAFPDAVVPPIVTGLLVAVDSSLIAIAFRYRAGLPPRFGWFAAANIVVLAALIHAVAVLHDLALRAFVTNLACSLLFLVTVAAIMARGRRTQPMEVAVGIVTFIFAMFELALAVMSLRVGTEGIAPAAATYREVLGIGLPASYVALGIGAVMLLVADLAARLEALTTRDPLTGALNRRGLDQAAVAAMANARRHKLPLSIMVIELEGFQGLANRIGRPAADDLLGLAADQLNASMREEDVFAHVEGARFCVLLGDTRLKQAQAMAAQAQADLAELGAGLSFMARLEARCGVAQLKPEDFAFGSLLRRAENAMPPHEDEDHAARNGRGRSAA